MVVGADTNAADAGEEAKTAVVTDSTSYLPRELVEAHGIREVSLYVTLEGRQEAELEIADYAEFYDRLRASEEGATTSQPSVGDFLAVYEPLLAGGGEVVSIHLSAGISGTCEAATQARAAPDRRRRRWRADPRLRQPHRVRRAGARGAGRRNAAARGGASAEQVLAHARAARDDAGDVVRASTRSSTCGEGGGSAPRRRCSGSTLKIKPILTLGEEITPVERVRTRARPRAPRRVRPRRHADGADAWVVQHIQDLESAQRLVEECRDIFGCEPAVRLRDRSGDRRPHRPRAGRGRQRDAGPARARTRPSQPCCRSGSRCRFKAAKRSQRQA